ncbi:hypothetical protein CCM_06239 [Cordyceps militaris CM01]|uniref:Uncharacterized protein n=1 Tax=Cordyceps militaris (strain CM01) TaxID=983644 RepID=G3JJJ1_CORMM|nr:uncharacterized protein CCM_06239 [Cordyceps militaris CM01]EGX92079.1 hypothetical protein CCM_06239 [Cordyceps militaris CM01]
MWASDLFIRLRAPQLVTAGDGCSRDHVRWGKNLCSILHYLIDSPLLTYRPRDAVLNDV